MRISAQSCRFACGLGLALLAACGGAPDSGPAPEARSAAASGTIRSLGTLEPGDPVQIPVVAGDEVAASLECEAGQFVQLVFDSERVDSVLTVTDPAGAEILRAGSAAYRWGEDRASFVTPIAGRYRMTLGIAVTAERRGEVSLGVAESRPVRPDDLRWLEIERAFSSALDLAEELSHESQEAALAGFEEVVRAFRNRSEGPWLARALFFAGITASEVNRFDDSIRALEEAHALWRELGEEGWQAETHFRIGNAHAFRGDLRRADDYFREAVTLWRQLGEREREAAALNNRGYALKRLGQVQAALDSYRAALEIFRELDAIEQQASALNNVGLAYRTLGDSERALEYYEESLPHLRRLGLRKKEAITLNNVGWCHKRLGQPERALQFFERALAIARELQDLRNQAIYLGSKGLALLDLAQPAGAAEACQQGYELSRQADDRRGQALRLACMGQASFALADLELANARLSEALEISRAIGDRRTAAEALYQLARTRRRQGRLLAAKGLLEEALEIIEGVRTDVDVQTMRSSYLAFHRHYYDDYIGLLKDLTVAFPNEDYENAAFQASERARARSLLEVLAEGAAGLRAEVDEQLLLEERSLREELNASLLRAGLPAAGVRRDSAQIRRLVERVEDVERRIRQGSPGYAEIAYPRPPSLSWVQEHLLQPNTLLLAYSLGDDRSWLWAISRESSEVSELPPRQELDAGVREFYDQLARPGGVGARAQLLEASSARLSRLLLGPVAERLAGQTLVIVPEGGLNYVPFAALDKPGTTARPTPLVADHEVVVVPSVAVLRSLRESVSARPRGEGLVVFADPVFQSWDPRLGGQVAAEGGEPSAEGVYLEGGLSRSRARSSLARLRHTREEGLAVADLAGYPQQRIALGFDATRELAVGGEAGRARLLHFATHGVLDSERPRLSGLVLSLFTEGGSPVDGFLRLHDIYRMKLQADLVVLSGCQTGLGKRIRGEGIESLTRGFFHAGARSVVASLWLVDDQATAELMRRFYRAIYEEGMRPAAALRAAQLAMFLGKAGARWREPYYWASFAFFGDWESSLG